MTRRDFLKSAPLAGLAATGGCASSAGAPMVNYGWRASDGTFRVSGLGLPEPLRVFVIGDTHMAEHDARDAAYADNYARVAQWPTPPKVLADALARAKAAKADLVLLAGDIISCPTLKNVETLTRLLDESGLKWRYVAGNHDWHFEGLPGSDEAQRAEWIPKRLAPLYHGEDPFCHSCVVKGVRFVAIDNSIYHVNARQLAFWKQEAAKGDPLVLFMHIPLHLPEWSGPQWEGSLELFSCGSPVWGAKTDPYWQIERRERWAERQSETTFAFRDAVLSTPNLAAVFTGHIHETLVGFHNGKGFFSVAKTRSAKDVFDVTFT